MNYHIEVTKKEEKCFYCGQSATLKLESEDIDKETGHREVTCFCEFCFDEVLGNKNGQRPN